MVTPDKLEQWRRLAQSGNLDAMAALGRHLLLAEPASGEEGMKWTAAAAAAHPEAAHLMAVALVYRASSPADVEAAFGHLAKAAELGHRPAQAEVAALAGAWRLAAEIRGGAASGEWRSLAGKVDPAS